MVIDEDDDTPMQEAATAAVAAPAVAPAVAAHAATPTITTVVEPTRTTTDPRSGSTESSTEEERLSRSNSSNDDLSSSFPPPPPGSSNTTNNNREETKEIEEDIATAARELAAAAAAAAAAVANGTDEGTKQAAAVMNTTTGNSSNNDNSEEAINRMDDPSSKPDGGGGGDASSSSSSSTTTAPKEPPNGVNNPPTAAAVSKKRPANSYPSNNHHHNKPPKKRRRSPFPSFPDMLYQLMAFKCRNGHSRVPANVQPLNAWCAFVRRAYNERKRGLPATYLTKERLDILNSIQFTWSLLQSSNDQRWEANFHKLLEFKKEKGHCNAPQSTPLGKWIQMQRDQKRERGLLEAGKKTGRPIIPLDRAEKLDQVGFCWRVAPLAVGWEGRFQELQDYKARFGTTNVPQGWKENIQLGRWVMKQRVQYHKRQRGEKSQMTDERISKLESIDFNWVGAGKVKSKLLKMTDQQQQQQLDVVEPPPAVATAVEEAAAAVTVLASDASDALPTVDKTTWI